MIDREMISAKFDIIEKDLEFLKEFNKMDDADFLNSYKNIQSAKYSLLEIIEACIDIAYHIVAAKGLGRAEDYREIFSILGKRGILDQKLASRLGDVAGFRNLLVHRYGEIDNLRVLEIINSELGDVLEFEQAVLQYLEKE
ncbi:MAG: DUF86 domain-containing protein [Candidatus Methanoperedens sp.]|jgi:uncharacterized protein YutE (UPF0331/DUF86 family)|nr:DUF86 domain-containing protein [Candidatus Methanoperedens sp.]PKL54410.1 MAG: DUF86 domain-containing protein [Candidatus Methanoperedenaceae archaeon HGW-Methanoperedenaceae-1]